MDKEKHNIRYWKCQLIGWSLAASYWTLQGFIAGNFNLGLAAVQWISDVLLYVTLTHLCRNFVLRSHWLTLPLSPLLRRIVPAILVMGIAYTIVTIAKIHLIRVAFHTMAPQQLMVLVKENGLGIFIAGIRLMSIWLLAYHFYQYAQRELRLTRQHAQLQLSVKEAQLDQLSAQLNPHFLFNAMNTIKSLVSTEPKLARRGIDLLSELLRDSLYRGQSVYVALGQEMALVKDYLELEQLRMEERLQFNIQVDPSLSTLQLPRMCIQILVENAIKHGLSKQKNGGLLTINIDTAEGFLNIAVCNDGTMLPHAHAGIGLKNLRERLRLAYGQQALFSIQNLPENTVCAHLKLPLP